MNTFKIIFLVMVLIDWLFVAYMHGKERPKYNIFIKIPSDLVGLALLTLGGFFLFN